MSIVTKEPAVWRVVLLRNLVICNAIALAVSLAFMAWNVALPHPIQCRETADTFGTALLLKGRNPFSLIERPDYFYSYGIVHSLLTYPLAWIFGPSFHVHRLVACTCLVASCGVLFRGMRESKVPRFIAACGALLLFYHLVFSFAISAKPDSVGLLFLLLSVYLPFRANFSFGSIALALLCSMAALYTKPYFVLGGPLLIAFVFLFRSKALGVAAGVLFAGFLGSSLYTVNALLPTYLTDVFYDQRNIAEWNFVHLVIMLMEYGLLGWGLVLILAWRVWTSPRRWEEKPFSNWMPKFDLVNPRQPFVLSSTPHWITFILVINTLIYLGKMGPHPGADIQYIFHIILPFLIWRACIIVGVERPLAVVPLLFLVLSLWSVVAFRMTPILVRTIFHAHDQTVTWEHAADLISSHRDVLGSRMVARLLWDGDRPVYDAGQGEYCPYALLNNPSKVVPEYRSRNQAQLEKIDEKIRSKQFDLVMMMGPSSPLFSKEVLARYYQKKETFQLYITYPWTHIDYNISVWEPLP